jgi:hypothetical protein
MTNFLESIKNLFNDKTLNKRVEKRVEKYVCGTDIYGRVNDLLTLRDSVYSTVVSNTNLKIQTTQLGTISRLVMRTMAPTFRDLTHKNLYNAWDRMEQQ